MRILLKLSGEFFAGENEGGVSSEKFLAYVETIKTLRGKGFEIALVLGGGNYWRYRDQKSVPISRVASDSLGMMATFMNTRLLQELLLGAGVPALGLGAHGNDYFLANYTPQKALEAMNSGKVVICGGGTGNPFFTTDTAAVLRALELNCDVLFKGTKVSGVYDKDPVKHQDAVLFEKLSFAEALERKLNVMDLTALTLCMENSLQVRVFNAQDPKNILLAAQGEAIGTLLN